MKLSKLLMAITLVLALAIPFALPTLAAAQEATITVSGAGVVTATPDIATVTLGVDTQHTNPQTALRDNNRAITAVLAAVRALGISEDDIQTRHFSIHQRHDWSGGFSRVIGYTVTNSVIITVRDLDLVGDVLGAGVADGANVSSGVSFSFEDASPLYLDALALAAADASRKANALAAALGLRIIGIQSVTETSTWAAPAARVQMDTAMPMPAMAMAGAADWSVPIETGELSVTARVSVVFVVGA